MSAAAALADELHRLWRDHRPFLAGEDGLTTYDDRVPDLSPEAEERYRAALEELSVRARVLPADGLEPHASITREVVLATADREARLLASDGLDHVVSTSMVEGPSAILTAAGRTTPARPEEAEAYLERCRQMSAYLRRHVERLRAGAEAGRRPVGSLVRAAIAQVEQDLADEAGGVLLSVPAPPGWNREPRWRAGLRQLVETEVRPALADWRDAVAGLPVRADDRCGLCHLPDGEKDYINLIRAHTTLDLAPGDVHRLGLAEVESVTDEVVALGREIGCDGMEEIMAAFLRSGAGVPAETAMAGSRAAVARAQDAIPAWVDGPIPGRCDVAAMAPHLAAAGHAPHYTPPRLDGSVPGTYWFNTNMPETGSGWNLEALAFHEAVPGHHLQMARAQQLTDLPDLQRLGFITAYGEGWALYAEQLADEAGLYSSTEARLGALVLRLFRSTRLMIDTGLHALGWSRGEATSQLLRRVPLPPAFAEAEVARYIAAPAQALGYAIGRRELVELRALAEARLGSRFDVRRFHAVLLDRGSVPLPTLRRIVEEWVAAC
ncbi:MAG TPA: DUF885 domain-containing protein [Baekduia sp.]|uniref:DUF885 domain-containing protein n=1 Tax=Baekduia sp. TaxID=2600305 RepID=UPI002D785BB4|nr:DUF885 domain-containing protein [Baekduia sp.]HET6509682.1 DUF885 domain-containing protein [Baekduia sp.]